MTNIESVLEMWFFKISKMQKFLDETIVKWFKCKEENMLLALENSKSSTY